MSFDIDPQDHYKRILCYHAESDNYFVAKSRAEFDHYCQFEQVDDVTDVECHENEFKKREAR
jgi:hypothetical protein